MFLGIADSTLGKDGRIVFPSKFRKDVGRKLFVTNWFEHSLIILPFDQGQNIMSRLTNDLVTLLPEGRKLERFLYGGAEGVTVNGEGRFLLPEHLKKYAHIQRDVVFRGIGDRIELWSKESYERYSFLTDDEARQTAISLYEVVKKHGK